MGINACSAGLHNFDLLWMLYNKLYDKSTTTRKPTASPQQITSKLHATISKSYNKSHDLLYDKSTASRSNGVRHIYTKLENLTNGNEW